MKETQSVVKPKVLISNTTKSNLNKLIYKVSSNTPSSSLGQNAQLTYKKPGVIINQSHLKNSGGSVQVDSSVSNMNLYNVKNHKVVVSQESMSNKGNQILNQMNSINKSNTTSTTINNKNSQIYTLSSQVKIGSIVKKESEKEKEKEKKVQNNNYNINLNLNFITPKSINTKNLVISSMSSTNKEKNCLVDYGQNLKNQIRFPSSVKGQTKINFLGNK